MLALLAALVSPLDGLGEDYLFSAHMVQHVLLGDIAPLLLLLSLSRVIMRPATRRLMRVERALGPARAPAATGIVLWLGLMYLWHIPALYDAALEHPLVHLLEHASFFTAGVALWWPLIQPVPMRRRPDGPAADRLHRRGQVRPRRARPLPDLELDRALPLLRGHAADLGPQRRSRTRTSAARS